jgi:REP-associated tyrosine transposase
MRRVDGQLSLLPKAKRRKRVRGTRQSVAHAPREVFSPRHPLHVTYSVREDIGRLRRRDLYLGIQRALRNCCAREGFRICHFSVQGNHIHLLIEASDGRALAKGMQGFAISCAKQINRRLGRRRGGVFSERYGCKIIKHPKQVRNTLSYVLNNWRKHGTGNAAPYLDVDPYSSAEYFDGWTHRRRWAEPLAVGAIARRSRRHEYDRLTDDTVPDMRPEVAAPMTAFLVSAWRRYGEVSPREVPGDNRTILG